MTSKECEAATLPLGVLAQSVLFPGGNGRGWPQVWDARTGKPVTQLMEHSAPLIDGGFSADGSLVFTRGRDRSIRVWSATTGEAVLLPIRYTSSRNGAQFSPVDPSLLVVIDGKAEVLDMPPSDVAPVWLADLAELAAQHSRFSPMPPMDPVSIAKLRSDLLGAIGDDRWSQFGRWYFTASNERTVTPWNRISFEEYVRQLVVLNTKESLSYAREIAFEHPAWMVKIDAAQKALASTTKH